MIWIIFVFLLFLILFMCYIFLEIWFDLFGFDLLCLIMFWLMNWKIEYIDEHVLMC